jgi:CO/xanthine dehydrogenase FAD-binding subunit
MLLREVEYARPASVQEALRLLGSHEGARALAGGQTLINVMKARAASPDVLVDLADIGELRGIELGSDVHATADYRRHLAEVLALRAVAQAAGRT